MSCDYPLRAWRSADPEHWSKGKHRLVFRKDQGFPNTEMLIPCGQCAGCRLDRARAWAIRCLHEASLHNKNCFITLTYNDENYPENGSLQKDHIVKFLKKLRKKISPTLIRFFQCGEYGEVCKNCGKSQVYCRCGEWLPSLGRPHHHCLIFGFDFPDKLLHRTGANPLYTSQTLSKLWTYGFHSIGELTFDSACYTARYILKKVTGDPSKDHYGDRLPEFITMSRNPGLGKGWLDLYHSDVYNHDRCVVSSSFIARPPKYYDAKYSALHSAHFSDIKNRRKIKAIEANANISDEDKEVRAEIRRIKMNKLPRSYEDG